MGGNSVKLKAGRLVIAFILFLIFPGTVLGAGNDIQHFTIDKDNQTINLDDDLQVIINNYDLVSTIHIKIHNKQVYTKNIYQGYIRSFYYFEKDHNNYILTEEKSYGTSSVLTFSLLRIESNNVELVQESDEYVRGLIRLTNDLELEVTYPKYKDGDSNASPSYMYRDKYTFSSDGFTKESSQDITNEKKPERNLVKQNRVMLFSTQSSSKKYENPSYAEINELLTKYAIKHGVPPEIVKAIAYQESTWRQFENGNYLLGSDGIGIGIMQYSDYRGKSEDFIHRLKYDIEFNIEQGILKLLEKWNSGGSYYLHGYLIPTINDNNKSIFEHWYFAIMAYNGRLERNDPLKNPETAYQQRIYDHIEKFGKTNITPFPVKIIKENDYFYVGKSMFFNVKNYQIDGPFHRSSHLLETNDIVRVTSNDATLRDKPGGNILARPEPGDILVLVKNENNKHLKNSPLAFVNSVDDHSAWYKVRNIVDNKEYYVEAHFVEKLDKLDKEEFSGYGRYHTSTLISQHGWKNQSDIVVLARGDNPVDGLSGSVLASKYDAPLLLIENDDLTHHVSRELDRLEPQKIYLLGGTSAITENVEKELKQRFGDDSVVRIDGSGRYRTAVNIAREVGSFQEVFIVSGDENSPDSLSIGSVAGKKGAPILFSASDGLTYHSLDFLRNQKDVKVYLIGGGKAVPNTVVQQLKNIGISEQNIERIGGASRYHTSIEIAKRFPIPAESIVFVSGESFIDALPGSPFAAKILNSPIILTHSNKAERVTKEWLNQEVEGLPKLYFLGGDAAISRSVRNELEDTIISKFVKTILK